MQPGEFLTALNRLNADCPQINGAVLATRDGLLLAATGCLQGEAAAASAADLAERIDHNLSLMAATECRELLVWAQPSAWYLTRLADQWVLMVCAAADCRTGLLRLAGHNAARQLSGLMAPAELNAHAETGCPVP